MTLSKFYPLIHAYSKIKILKDNTIIYWGMLKDTPDELNDSIVQDFEFSNGTGFTFYVE